eukprot:COSAG04_NODE_6777_length_1258_cov_1.293356_2_plen_92_part_00
MDADSVTVVDRVMNTGDGQEAGDGGQRREGQGGDGGGDDGGREEPRRERGRRSMVEAMQCVDADGDRSQVCYHSNGGHGGRDVGRAGVARR